MLRSDGFTNQPNQLHLNDVIALSPQEHGTTQTKSEYIISEFNKPVAKDDSCFTTSYLRGELIQPNMFLLGHKNQRAELVGSEKNRYVARQLTLDPTTTSVILGRYSQNESFFGAFGSYVLNVPVGQYAKGMSGNIPVIFGPGPHVIHDPLFTFDVKQGYIRQTDIYIKHGNINILRVPYGAVAKIMIGTKPMILEARPEPYVFNDPLFSFDMGTGLVDQITPYIDHKTIHILRVPAGKIATVWDGAEPLFLESRPEPYVFNSAIFRVERKNLGELFYNSTDPLIKHGYKKRLMVHTGQVAVTWNNGNLQVIAPRDDSKPTIIDEPNHEVSDEFLSTGMLNLEFPSKFTRAKRLEDNAKSSSDELAYELFTTKDSLKVGVKLYVAIRIENPQLALSKLTNLQGILEHVESCATVDMGMAIQQCTSQEFLNSYQTKPSQRKRGLSNDSVIESGEVAENKDLSIQDEVKARLSKDLSEIGISLIRMNFESPRIIDPEIAKKMSAQSLATAEASSKEALLEKNFTIANRTAEQEANTRRVGAEQEARAKSIAQQQANEAVISAAQAEKDAAKLKAEALVMRAEAEKQAALLRGQAYMENPRLFDLEMMRVQMEALGKANVVPPQVANLLTSGMYASPFTLFGGLQRAATEAQGKIIELPRPDDQKAASM